MTQDEIFINGEGDQWYLRNKEAISNPTRCDHVLQTILDKGIVPTRLLDIGCAAGDKLNGMQRAFNCEAYGIDTSLTAIIAGRDKYPNLTLTRTGVASMNFPNKFFDTITANFVFHWIDRDNLLTACAKIDKCLKWGGQLVISDFYHRDFRKRKYHHTDDGMFTYKQYYPEIFMVTGNYRCIREFIYFYDKTDTAFVAILEKINVSTEEII
jgi:ubiquinone/menaquinone biosynthesis C-methylase UbiE